MVLIQARHLRGSLMKSFLRLSALVAAGFAGGACAQQIPAPEAGTRLVDVRMIDGEIVMRDAGDGRILIHNRGLKLHDANGPDCLTPEIKLNPQPTGFDLEVMYDNQSGRERPVGDLNLGVITLGRNILYQDFRHTGVAMPVDNVTLSGLGWYYPGDLYSPVAVLRNDRHAIGISLQYPVLAYEHDVCVSLLTPRGAFLEGEGGQGWNVHFGLAGKPHGRTMKHPAHLKAGEKRRYVLSVRVTRQPEEWIRTLTPYRNYFVWGYGGVRYQRDPNPVLAVNPTDGSFISASNRWGWGYPSRRPDVHGWGPWVHYLTTDMAAWKNLMIWAPSGLYDQNREMNYPFQFTTHWRAHPRTATATNPVNGLPAIKARGQTLGLWWGRAVQVATRWNPSEMVPLDLRNPAHVAAAMAELDLAVEAGATVIGLDTFDHGLLPVWDQVEWLAAMQERAPGVKFVTEPSNCDVIHRLAPTFVDGWTSDPNPRNTDELYRVKNPNYLADFLLPGHETWVGLRWDLWSTHFGQSPGMQRIRQDIIRHANMGYVPVVFYDVPASTQFRAAPSWTETVPQDLRIAPGAPAGILAQPGGGGLPSGGVSSGTPLNPFTAARLFTRAELRRAIRAVMWNLP